MHDTNRGGTPTAVRLAAFAASRKARSDAGVADRDEGRPAQDGSSDIATHRVRAQADAPEATVPQTAAQKLDRSNGVYAAVEAAVKRSRVEFLARLLEYRQKLDCDTFRSGRPETLGASLDDAQFVAHRIAGVGKTLGFADLGDQARQTEAAIAAYKLESTVDLRHTAVARICKLVGLIESTCAEHEDCQA